MDRKQELLIWLAKIEKQGIPDKKIFKSIWTEVIKVIKANETWNGIEKYVAKNKNTFLGNQQMMGPHAARVVFDQISGKIWSINRQYAKRNK